jgi:hypothetical protein
MKSRQIQIAHDKADERDLINWLQAKADLRSLPATTRETELRPGALADCNVARQVVFLARDERRVVEAARPSPEGLDMLVVAHSSVRGWYFEWNRTRVDASSVYAPMGVGGSRIYFPGPLDGVRSSDELRKLIVALIGWIRKSSPLISTDRYPIYVGRSLSERVIRREARLVTPKGEVIELVPNPKHA